MEKATVDTMQLVIMNCDIPSTNIVQMLQDACFEGHNLVVESIISSNLEYSMVKMVDFKWCVEIACQHGFYEIVELLLPYHHKLNPNLSISIDQALISACRNGHYKIVKLLLEHIQQYNFQTLSLSIESAIENGHYHIAELLQSI